MVQGVASRLVTATIPYLLTRLGVASRFWTAVKIARALLRILKRVLSRRHFVGRFSRTHERNLSHRNCDFLSQRFERFASSKEFHFGPLHTLDLVIDTVNRIWHFFDSLDLLLSATFGTCGLSQVATFSQPFLEGISSALPVFVEPLRVWFGGDLEALGGHVTWIG